MSLATKFAQRWGGRHPPADPDLPALEDALESLLEVARERWPSLELPPEPLVEFLADRAPAEDPVGWLKQVPAFERMNLRSSYT